MLITFTAPSTAQTYDLGAAPLCNSGHYRLTYLKASFTLNTHANGHGFTHAIAWNRLLLQHGILLVRADSVLVRSGVQP
eukprot:6180394-Pleurochrysis_carterae.AAC.1